jgi:hypothetical protein
VTAYNRKSKLKDILAVANNMRAADVAEVHAASGREPKEVLLQCFFEGKPCLTICDTNDMPVAMWGVVPVSEMVGGVWLLGTDALVKDSKTRMGFLRQARAAVDQVQEEYPVLANCVDARNKVHVRWLQWMGFTIIKEHPNYGAEGRAFLEFVRMRHV